jgi:hypothetical protein
VSRPFDEDRVGHLLELLEGGVDSLELVSAVVFPINIFAGVATGDNHRRHHRRGDLELKPIFEENNIFIHLRSLRKMRLGPSTFAPSTVTCFCPTGFM